MNKSKLSLQPLFKSLLGLLSLGLFLTQTTPAQAACNFHTGMTPSTKNVADTWTCTISGVEGVDEASSETSTTNTAALTINAGSSITINNGGKLVAGQLNLAEGASIAIAAGAEMAIGAPLYVTDADADGWVSDFTLFDANASGRRRLALMRDFNTADCNDTNDPRLDNVCCTVATRYRDADGDGYGNPSVMISACPTSGYVDNSTDCYDNNANVHPGSTTCSASHRGDGSYDYNCSGGGTACNIQYYLYEYRHFLFESQGSCHSLNGNITRGTASCGTYGCTRGEYKSQAWVSDCSDPWAAYLCGSYGNQTCQ